MTTARKLRHKLSKLHKPAFFPVYSGSSPEWKWESVLVMFEECPSSPNRHWRVEKGWDYDNTVIMVESGGLARVKPKDQLECMKKQLRIFPDLTLTLDYPIKILRADKGRGGEQLLELVKMPEPQKMRRVQKTIESAKIAMKLKDELISQYEHYFEPVAVIQAYDTKSLIYATSEIYSLGYDFICSGGITTCSFMRKFVPTVRALKDIRDIVGKKVWIHMLGVTALDLLTRLEGYNSFDSATASIEAKNAHLILPTWGTVTIGKNVGGAGLKYHHLNPRNRDGYLKLQQINFENMVKRFERFLWRKNKK